MYQKKQKQEFYTLLFNCQISCFLFKFMVNSVTKREFKYRPEIKMRQVKRGDSNANL